ncbi:MAG: LD-carboxypeptidase [Peptococcaceae bacterium]|jgi:muramoyltetrapeptide carboxypeptidase|nr:LD-carboxypeptidase [Peptococcaceae bacterium]
MIFPHALKMGDAVGLIAPSSPVPAERLEACKSLLESQGYKVKEGRGIYSSLHGYQGGPAAVRAADINAMFADPEVKAIFCLKGGYSSAQVMDKLDLRLIRANPKIFVGYSDVTNLNVFLNQQAGMVTFHGPMVHSNMLKSYDDFTRASFEAALALGASGSLELKNPQGEPFRTLRPGRAEGIIAGGNLSLLCSMLGTPYEIDTRGKILFFEDVNESIPHIDRMLYQLKYSGKLDQAAGVAAGDFSGQSNPDDPAYMADELLRDFFTGYQKPVVDNIKSGHCYPMSSIPLGALCRLDTDGTKGQAGAEPKITFHLP